MLTTVGISSTQERLSNEVEFEWRKTMESVQARSEKENTVIELLHESAKHGRLDIVKSLVKESHVNPNSRDRKGWTALLRATKANHLDCVEFLIQCKADLNAQTRELNTALHKAAKRHRKEAAAMLIKAQADLNMVNKGAATPLMMAALSRSCAGVLTLLIEARADINVQKDVGYSALMLAARQGNGRGLVELIQARADLEAHDRRRETALAKAQKYHREEVATLLIQSGATRVGLPRSQDSKSTTSTRHGGSTQQDSKSASGHRRSK